MYKNFEQLKKYIISLAVCLCRKYTKISLTPDTYFFMKKSVTHLLIICCVFLCHSCKNDAKNVSKNYTHTFTISDSLDIRIPDSIPISFLKNDFKNNILYGLQNDDIIKIDIAEKKVVGKIEIPNFYVTSELSSIHVITNDSILVTDSETSFLLVNGQGDVLNSYDITKNSILPEDGQILTLLPHVRLQEDNQYVYFPVLHYAALVKPWEYHTSNRIGVVNLATEKVTDFFIPTAKSAAVAKGYNYPDDVAEPNVSVINNRILVAYPYDDTVEVFSASGEFLFRKQIQSQYIPETPKPLKTATYKTRQKNWNYRITMPFYDNINYHEDVGLYSRIAYHEQPLKMNNGKLNNGSNRSASILLMDSEFNIVGETLFENGSLGVYKSIPLPDGYLIGSNQQHWKFENQLIYTMRLQIEKLP